MRRLALVMTAVLAALAAPARGQLDKGKGLDDWITPPAAPSVAPLDADGVMALSAAAQAQNELEFVIAVVMDFEEGWHAWPSAAQDVLPKWDNFSPERTSIAVDDPDGIIDRIGPIQWPEPHDAPVADPTGASSTPILVKTYSDRSIAFVPLVLNADTISGEHNLNITVTYQACNDSMCQMPTDTAAPVSLNADQGSDDELFEQFDPSVFERMRADPTLGTKPGELATTTGGALGAAGGRSFFGIPVTGGLVVLALLAALGGLILNLTPCVLPVIPIKVMTISSHAGSPGKSLFLGLWMAAGVIAFWVGIGLPAALFVEFADPSIIFGIWWVTAGIGLLIGAMGVGIMGMFQITLPQKVYAVNPKADSALGSFMFGVMTGVLGLPCFGFVAGALLAGAATLPTYTILSVFTFIGVGMASPYFVLSAKPSWVSKIPRTGPASELVKQVMGLLMLAAAAYFLGSAAIGYISERPSLSTSLPWWGKVTHWWIVALLVAVAGFWLIIKTFAITKMTANRLVFSLVGLVIGAIAIAWAADTTVTAKNSVWVAYDEEALQAALDNDKVVVLDFTGEWCLNCKALKATVLNREPVKSELRKSDVIAMTVDLTSRKAPGWDKLRDLGQTGIPLLVIYGPALDRDEPWQANAYTPGQVMDALALARGGDAPALANRD